MSEEAAGGNSAPEGNGAGIDPTAVALALAGASREEADSFLRDQRVLIAGQLHHLHEQLKQIHLDIAEKWLGILLRLATLAIGLSVATGLALGVWDASRAEGTAVDAFSVPPQLAQAGITGEVVATDLTERITSIHDITQRASLTNPKEVRREGIDEIKVEIPETGVSLGQAWRFLRHWLGHERRITGALRYVSEGQLALSVSVDGQRIFDERAPVENLDKLEQRAAEEVFADVEPINIVLYLRDTGREAEALRHAEHGVQIAQGVIGRARAFGLWASLTRSQGDMRLSLQRAQIGAAINPKLIVNQREIMWAHVFMGHDEDALQVAQFMRTFREEDQAIYQQGQGFREIVSEGAFERNSLLGDFAQAASDGDCVLCPPAQQLISRAEAFARAHDVRASRKLTDMAKGEPPALVDRRNPRGAYISRSVYFQDVALGNWSGALADARAYEAEVRADATLSPGYQAARLKLQVAPLLAYSMARNGDEAGARATLAATPRDCYDCVRTLALIAAAAGKWDEADAAFARAVRDAPSVPIAYADWGHALLARGEPDDAIVQFKLASQKGPHFADPLEGWGEALMAKNQSHLALAKFKEADKYAANWGRLHLKWGEAFAYSGKAAEAKAQFVRAAALDLTPSERSELARFGHV